MKLHHTQQARLSPFASQNRQTQKAPPRDELLLHAGREAGAFVPYFE